MAPELGQRGMDEGTKKAVGQWMPDGLESFVEPVTGIEPATH